jgi:hypothetical protein
MTIAMKLDSNTSHPIVSTGVSDRYRWGAAGFARGCAPMRPTIDAVEINSYKHKHFAHNLQACSVGGACSRNTDRNHGCSQPVTVKLHACSQVMHNLLVNLDQHHRQNLIILESTPKTNLHALERCHDTAALSVRTPNTFSASRCRHELAVTVQIHNQHPKPSELLKRSVPLPGRS